MPLLDNPTISPAEAEAEAAIDAAARLHGVIQAQQSAAFRTFWRGTRDEVTARLAALGTRAVPLFTVSAQLWAIIQSAKSGVPDLTPPFAYTAHDDGTVTLDPVPPAPAPPAS